MRVHGKMVAWCELKMRYQFLIDTYQTEIVKVLGVWSMFDDADLRRRPHPTDSRGRSLLEHVVHQCFSEDFWFKMMLGIKVTDAPLPENETRLGFMQCYARDSALRLAALSAKTEEWWEGETSFFEERRTRLWVITRRLTHTSHHRGQQTTLLRMMNHNLHSTYGPTADTGGLMINHAPTVYAYASQSDMLAGEEGDRHKTPLPGPGEKPFTERPDRSGTTLI
jgi:uncharacterized damage-inducible protein DinB